MTVSQTGEYSLSLYNSNIYSHNHHHFQRSLSNGLPAPCWTMSSTANTINGQSAAVQPTQLMDNQQYSQHDYWTVNSTVNTITGQSAVQPTRLLDSEQYSQHDYWIMGSTSNTITGQSAVHPTRLLDNQQYSQHNNILKYIWLNQIVTKWRVLTYYKVLIYVCMFTWKQNSAVTVNLWFNVPTYCTCFYVFTFINVVAYKCEVHNLLADWPIRDCMGCSYLCSVGWR